MTFHSIKRQLGVLFGVLVCATYLAACATPKPDPNSTQFSTKITKSGLKHFEVKLKRPARSEPKPLVTQNKNAQNKQKLSRQRKATKNLRQYLVASTEIHLGSSQYCREGFWILDENLYGSKSYLRGECNEPASEEDRTQFPGTISYW